MFSPDEAYNAVDLEEAFSTVVAELQGAPEVAQRLHAGRNEFLQLLNDPRKAGLWVAQTLNGLDWDWPRWRDHVKTSGLKPLTVPALRKQASKIKPAEALSMLNISEIKELLHAHSGKVPTNAKKDNLLQAVQALPLGTLDSIVRPVVQQWLDIELWDCRIKMGGRIGLRIAQLCYARQRLRQLTDPDLLLRRPQWEFFCGDQTSPSKSCQRLHGKTLFASEAIKAFPTLPCERLDCACRILAK